MIGFPGETEEDLLDTIDVVEKVKYVMHLLLYILRERELQQLNGRPNSRKC